MTMIHPLQIQYIFTAPLETGIHSTMAVTPTPEELLGLAEPAPLSPSIFLDLDLPLATNGDSQQGQPQNDLALECISRMLMEEDIMDKFFYEYPDNPKLLQAEQPFTEILSATANTMPSHGNNTDITVSGWQVRNPAVLLTGTGTSFLSESSSSRTDILSSMAFFKGMEEANRFLPRVTDNVLVDGRGHKKRSGIHGETEACMGRSSKQAVVLRRSVSSSLEEDEEATALEMLDRLILNGYDAYPGEMQEVVRVTREDKENKAAALGRRGPRRGARHAVVTDLETLLIRCAEAVSSNDVPGASKLLERIKWHSSPTGDPKQRLAHYFAQGLEARLAGTGSRLYRALVGKRISAVELIKAYHLHMAACCSMKVGLLFSMHTIYKAAAGRRKLHIVHYGISTGFQWPDLLRLLANREGGPPEVRITGINTPEPGLRPAQLLEEAGQRLSNYARQFGVPFEFCPIASKPENVRVEDLRIDPDEVLVVNSLYEFRTFMDESLTFDMVSPRDMVLNTISKMRPSVFVQSLVNGPYSAAFFMTRFRHALYFFMALFDVMETTVPRDNDKRLMVERDILARSAINMIACEGADRVERPQNYKEWQARKQRAGLRQLPLDPDIVLMLKDEVKSRYHKHFMISEDQHWLLQGWKGRVLYAHSTWAADDATASQVID